MMTLIGHGKLSWNSVERRSDRYGTVRLYKEDEPVPLFGQDMEGTKGRLVAHIIKNGDSQHVGDMFRGIRPPKPPLEIGTKVVLGEGLFFHEHVGDAPHEKSETEKADDEMFNIFRQAMSKFGNVSITEDAPEIYDQVGLKPEDGREQDWLDPQELYNCHDQIVDLYFEVDDVS